jgi:hypothetical protein
MEPPIPFSSFEPYSHIRGAERSKSPLAESGDACIRIGEHMPAWSVMDLSSLQAAEHPFQYFNIYLFIYLLIMLSCREPDERGGEGKRASTAAGGRGTARA